MAHFLLPPLTYSCLLPESLSHAWQTCNLEQSKYKASQKFQHVFLGDICIYTVNKNTYYTIIYHISYIVIYPNSNQAKRTQDKPLVPWWKMVPLGTPCINESSKRSCIGDLIGDYNHHGSSTCSSRNAWMLSAY